MDNRQSCQGPTAHLAIQEPAVEISTWGRVPLGSGVEAGQRTIPGGDEREIESGGNEPRMAHESASAHRERTRVAIPPATRTLRSATSRVRKLSGGDEDATRRAEERESEDEPEDLGCAAS